MQDWQFFCFVIFGQLLRLLSQHFGLGFDFVADALTHSAVFLNLELFDLLSLLS
jgi:hypothetical protein